MTEQELAEIEARAAAANPPPWTRDPERHTSEDWVVSGVDVVHAADGEFVLEVGYPAWPARAANLTFLAAAREDVPQLVAEVRRLRGALADATQALASIERCGQRHGDDAR